MTFETNWNFSEKYIHNIAEILRANAMHIVDIEVATPEDDMKHATDLKITIKGGDIAVRIRRSKWSYRDITIRAYKNGNRTEIDKLRDGYGDWYLYAWEASDQNSLAEWVLIDINKARELFLQERPIKMNNDQTSGFIAYSIDEFKNINAVVEHRS